MTFSKLIITSFVIVFFGISQAQEYTIKFATLAPEGTPWSEQTYAMKERIEKESDGRIKMRIYLAGQLGGELEMINSLKRGRIQAWGGSIGALTTQIPQLSVLEFPYLFDSYEEIDFILDSLLFEPVTELLQNYGFIFHSWNENGWRNIGSRGKKVLTPADLVGMKVRSQESDVHLAMWKTWGANPEYISTVETLPSLQTGVVDGFDQSVVFGAGAGWTQQVDYYTMTKHIYQPGIIIYSKRFWDSLPEDLQKIILGDQHGESRLGRGGVRETTPILIEEIIKTVHETEVIELTDEQRNAFKEVVLPIREKYAGLGEELYKMILDGKKQFKNQKELLPATE